MASPNEKLADSLSALRKLQASGRNVFKSGSLSRVHRERLIEHGFLREVMKGWLISSRPGERPGDSTPWYASFWDFCGVYCQERFGSDWHLSPDQSLLLNAECWDVPRQTLVYSARASNNITQLPFGTSIYDLKERTPPRPGEVVASGGLRVFTMAAALCRIQDRFFSAKPVEAQIALLGIDTPSELLAKLLEDGQSTVAGRLVGAFRHVGRTEIADEILTTMKSVGYDVREADPFTAPAVEIVAAGRSSPIAFRLRSMWMACRHRIVETFPPAPGLPAGVAREQFLDFLEEIYTSDAYHSLSIEGYTVTSALIERVRAQGWDPAAREQDSRDLNALAARGYWQAFQSVKASIADIVDGADAAAIARADHRKWYRELFEPCVVAGALKPSDLAGYRGNPVYLRTSRFIPPRHGVVHDAMATLFDLIEGESEPSVKAVLGHWLIGFIHPFPDGNGRTARFLMNAMLASGGYPWTVVRVEDRTEYLAALDAASLDADIGPFADFMACRVRWSMERMPPPSDIASPGHLEP